MMGWIRSLLSPGTKVTPNTRNAPFDVLTDGEDGFADLSFALAEARQRGMRAELTARGLYRGEPVGFRALLEAEDGPGRKLSDVDLTIHRASVTLVSIGEESDRLVQALGALYGSEAGARMASSPPLTALSLEGDPRELFGAPVRLKLFHEPAAETAEGERGDERSNYFELYLNVDGQAGHVQLHEKDQEYRGAILRVLAPG